MASNRFAIKNDAVDTAPEGTMPHMISIKTMGIGHPFSLARFVRLEVAYVKEPRIAPNITARSRESFSKAGNTGKMIIPEMKMR